MKIQRKKNSAMKAVGLSCVLFATFTSCKSRTNPKDAPHQANANRQANGAEMGIWNGQQSTDRSVAGLIGYQSINVPNSVIGPGATATAYLTPGCYITNRHVLEAMANHSALIRLETFANLQNAFTAEPPSGHPVNVMADRQKLADGHFIRVLQRKLHPVAAENLNNRHDLAVFFSPRVGHKYKYLNEFQPTIDLYNYESVSHQPAQLATGAILPGEEGKAVGFGLRNHTTATSDIGNGDFGAGIDQRHLIRREGFVTYHSQPGGANSDILLFDPATNYAHSINLGDSGGKLSKDGAIRGILTGKFDPEMPFPVFVPNNNHLPVAVEWITIVTDVREEKNNKFLTDENYNKATGQNAKLVCRPKPFIEHGPAMAYSLQQANGTTLTAYAVHPQSELGHVKAENVDPKGEYQNTTRLCGKTGTPLVAQTECRHDTWENNVPNNSPVIDIKLTAIPNAGFLFDRWVSGYQKKCLCPNETNPVCPMTNVGIEAAAPEALLSEHMVTCLAKFKPTNPNNPCPPSNPACLIE
jgi:hypothetical protein